ncbi:TPA: MATE family efflux transporter [Citrobacter freundii]
MKKIVSFLKGNVLVANALSNYMAAAWLGITSILLTPIYLKVLGPSQWGVVSICIAVQAFMFLVDAGLAQIMPRDIAKEKTIKGLQSVYLTYNYVYFFLAIVFFIIGYLFSPYVISHWLNPNASVMNVLSVALNLLLAQFCFQLINNSNLCFWYGTQRQHIACLRQVIFFSLKHLFALILIFFWEKNAVSYQLSFLIFSIAECLLNRHAILRELKFTKGMKFNFDVGRLRKLFKESGILSFAILLGMLTTQVDKIVLSKQVSIEIFGYYSVIAFLGAAFLQLQYPLVRAFLPKLTKESHNENSNAYFVMFKFIFLFCICPTALAIIFSEQILLLWLHNSEIAALGSFTLKLILMATIINSLYNIIYQKIIISGSGRYVMLINSICLVIVFPLTYHLSERFGIVAGGVSWLSTALIQLMFGIIWVAARRKKYE